MRREQHMLIRKFHAISYCRSCGILGIISAVEVQRRTRVSSAIWLAYCLRRWKAEVSQMILSVQTTQLVSELRLLCRGKFSFPGSLLLYNLFSASQVIWRYSIVFVKKELLFRCVEPENVSCSVCKKKYFKVDFRYLQMQM